MQMATPRRDLMMSPTMKKSVLAAVAAVVEKLTMPSLTSRTHDEQLVVQF